MLDDQIVKLGHRKGSPLASGLPLTRLRATGVIAILLAAPRRAQGHRAAAVRTMADAAQHRAGTHEARRLQLRCAAGEQLADLLELLPRDNRRHFLLDDLILRLRFLLAAIKDIEAMRAGIGRSRQDVIDHPVAEPPAGRCANAALVQIVRDLAHAERSGLAIAQSGQLEYQPHMIGLVRIDRELLLHPHAALLGIGNPIAERRARSVPITLPGILAHGAQRVLGIFLRLILVEQRHDLAHHHAHRIVAQNLRDRDEFHPVLRQLANIEFRLEVIAEEA
jgi:hypothetical protein